MPTKRQTLKLLDVLRRGHNTTNLLAISNLGISSVTSRVAELRALGWPIMSTRKKDPEGQRYVEFSLPAMYQNAKTGG